MFHVGWKHDREDNEIRGDEYKEYTHPHPGGSTVRQSVPARDRGVRDDTSAHAVTDRVPAETAHKHLTVSSLRKFLY